MTSEDINRERRYPDRWLIAYWIVMLQGLASALPWNVYITETEFFNLRAHQAAYLPVVADNFESINLLTSMAGQMVGFLLYLPLHHAMSLDLQVLWPQVLTLGVMLATVALTLMDVSGNAFMAFILSAQVVLGITNATIVGGVYQLASWLPATYIQGMSLGVGIAGTAVSAISFLTLAAVSRQEVAPSPAEVAPAAFAYFTGSAMIVVLAIVTYFVFFMLPYVHSHSIPEDFVGEPQNLRRESASFLRARTRSMSSDMLSASISRSLNELERPFLLSTSQGRESGLADVPDWEAGGEDSSEGLEPSYHASSSALSTPAASPPPEASGRRDVGDGLPGEPWQEGQSFEAREVMAGPHAPLIMLRHPVNGAGQGSHPCSQSAADLRQRGRVSSEGRGRTVGTLKAEQQTQHGTGSCTGVAVAIKQEAVEPDMTLLEVVSRLRTFILILGLNSVTTLATFPGLTSLVCSEHNGAVRAPCVSTTPKGRFFGDLFVPFMFLVCNASDLLGRLLAGVGPWTERPPSNALFWVYSLSRIPMSVPLLFCKVVTPRSWVLPLLFRSDAWPLGIAALLGLTNGHLQSIALMHAPAAVPKSARDRVGPLLNCSLAAGTTLGSVISFLLTYYLQR